MTEPPSKALDLSRAIEQLSPDPPDLRETAYSYQYPRGSNRATLSEIGRILVWSVAAKRRVRRELPTGCIMSRRSAGYAAPLLALIRFYR